MPWNRQVARRAQQHAQNMDMTFKNAILNCAKQSKIYRNSISFDLPAQSYTKQNLIVLEPETTTEAIFRYVGQGKKVAALNFASYKEPGGKFLEGSTAQEESLCHTSFLYNVLREHQDYYDENRKNLNRGLYTNAAIYSPDVGFTKDSGFNWASADIITCAAPNWGTAEKNGVNHDENLLALTSRCLFVLDIALANKVDTLILGAYGCGVFKQDPVEVCNTFLELLDRFGKTFDTVVFAIPASGNNYSTFSQLIENHKKI
jgi:uncharacterized protein (TIGR02452 family)